MLSRKEQKALDRARLKLHTRHKRGGSLREAIRTILTLKKKDNRP